jgi:very-short-patch-repair endonuclease
VRDKIRKTKNEKYGEALLAVVEKTKLTNVTKYGVSCPLHHAQIAKHKKETWIANYGVDNPAKADIVKTKTRNTVVANSVNKKNDRLLLLEQEGISPLFDTWEGGDKDYMWRCKCGTEFQYHFIGNVVPRCPSCFPRSSSMEEKKIAVFLEECGVEFIRNNRTVIPPLELDFVIPSAKIAIEVNGMYWHDVNNPTSLLHKTEKASEQGYLLLHFWDFEINEKMAVVKSIIASKLGISKRVYARKCVAREISYKDSAAFLNSHHLAGAARAKKHFGLFYNQELMCVATFSPARFEKTNAWELVRFASKGTVVGGLSKLISAFNAEKHAIISYADRRISNGRAYASSGFSLIGQTKQNYFYFKGNKRLARQQAMKHKLPSILNSFNADLTEYDNMLLNGWSKCLDCGSFKFILEHK